jgi:hypothetical protein
MIAALAYGFIRNIGRREPSVILLLSFTSPLILFGIMAFKGHVEANWAVMGYPSAVILSVELVGRAWKQGKPQLLTRFSPRFCCWAVSINIGLVALVVFHAWVGLLPASVERRLGKADRIIWETRGWDDLGQHVGKLRKNDDVIAGDSYQMAASLWFNVPGQKPARYLAPWKRPTQFDVREPSFDNLAGKTILFVSSKELAPSTEGKLSIYENFTKIEPLAPSQVMYHGESIRKIHVYRCYGFDPFSPRRLGPRSLLYRDY